jgi:hypothetical protein
MISLLKYALKQPLAITALHLHPIQASHPLDSQPISAIINYAFCGKT